MLLSDRIIGSYNPQVRVQVPDSPPPARLQVMAWRFFDYLQKTALPANIKTKMEKLAETKEQGHNLIITGLFSR